MGEQKMFREKRVSLSHIKAAMMENEITRSEVAKQIGISEISMRDKLNGHSSINLRDLEAIQAMTNKSFDYFFED